MNQVNINLLSSGYFIRLSNELIVDGLIYWYYSGQWSEVHTSFKKIWLRYGMGEGRRGPVSRLP